MGTKENERASEKLTLGIHDPMEEERRSNSSMGKLGI